MNEIIKQLLFGISFVLATIYLLNQVRKPTRWLGQPFVWLMNFHHAPLTNWGLKQVQVEQNATILDIGCGGGRTLQKLAALAPEGHVYGIDYADGSLAAARQTNAQLIKAGRVEIRQASVSQLPFPDHFFDLVTAVETHYYWPDLVHDFEEIRRVLKPGGSLLLLAESYKIGWSAVIEGIAMKLLRAAYLSAEEHRALLLAAGFAEVQLLENTKKSWLCVQGYTSAKLTNKESASVK